MYVSHVFISNGQRIWDGKTFTECQGTIPHIWVWRENPGVLFLAEKTHTGVPWTDGKVTLWAMGGQHLSLLCSRPTKLASGNHVALCTTWSTCLGKRKRDDQGGGWSGWTWHKEGLSKLCWINEQRCWGKPVPRGSLAQSCSCKQLSAVVSSFYSESLVLNDSSTDQPWSIHCLSWPLSFTFWLGL